MIMLDELKNLKTPGNQEGFWFVLGNIIGDKQLSYEDIRVLCSHAPAKCQIAFPEMIQYCWGFGWIDINENVVKLTPEVLESYKDANQLNDLLIQKTLLALFESEIFRINMFSFDAISHQTLFRNELFPLSYSSVRNTLINMGFFNVERSLHGTTFFVAPAYEKVLSKLCKKEKKKLTLSQLRKKIEADAEIGEKAEKFVLVYEQNRIDAPLSEKVKIISDIDVTAGYDIISYESNSSIDYDRFIEVKASSHDMGFYWSRNEYEIAKLKGEHYYLYLVDIAKISEPGYVPAIIQNPAETIMCSAEWMVEPQSYKVHKI